MKTIKLLSLNIYNYHDWNERKPKIVDFIRKHNPDIISFQEVRDDAQFNKKGDNQAKQLNNELNYPYYSFFTTTDKKKEHPERYALDCTEGTAILSKFPILKAEKVKLKKNSEDIHNCGNLHVKIKANNKIIEVIAVHFSNKDLFSLLHLIETLKYTKEKKIKPIIMGDFNVKFPDWLHDLTEDSFKSSFKYKKYISLPSENITLDYIIIPKKFNFKSVKCEGEGISDHKALIAEIEIK